MHSFLNKDVFHVIKLYRMPYINDRLYMKSKGGQRPGSGRKPKRYYPLYVKLPADGIRAVKQFARAHKISMGEAIYKRFVEPYAEDI